MKTLLPRIKFFKDQVEAVLKGEKTLEVRPRSQAWVNRLRFAERVEFTCGPRFGRPQVFAVAAIEKVEIKPFDRATKRDLARLARGWEKRTLAEYVAVHEKWFSKELSKGYPVAWIYFRLIR
jgi:hypothetical protein